MHDQEPLFGKVASNDTAFRVIEAIARDPGLLDALRAARARGGENAWPAEVLPERIVIDIDATLVCAHSEMAGAAGTFKGSFGLHPLLAYLESGTFRPENSQDSRKLRTFISLRPPPAGSPTRTDCRIV